MLRYCTDRGNIFELNLGKVHYKHKDKSSKDSFMATSFKEQAVKNNIRLVTIEDSDKPLIRNLFELLLGNKLYEMFDYLLISRDSKYIFLEDVHENEYSIYKIPKDILVGKEQRNLLAKYSLKDLIYS